MAMPTPTYAPTETKLPTSGAAMAALLAAAIGLVALGAVQLASDLSKGVSDFVFAVGKAWIPNAQGIGPYSGKETFLLVAWLGSWAVLHYRMRGTNPDVKTTFALFLGLMFVATLLVWPPVWHLFKGA